MKFTVFDCATRGDFADICCAVSFNSETGYKYWYSQNVDAQPMVDMRQEDKINLAQYLIGSQAEGFQVYGWGTQSYDFPLLYTETELEKIKILAKDHIDLQFDLLNQTGTLYPLYGVARNYSVGFDPDMSKHVPDLWNSNNINCMRNVLLHVKAQVTAVVKIVEACYPEESENQLPLHVSFMDSQGKLIQLPMNGLPVQWTAKAYNIVPKHALQQPYVKALDWIGTWNS